MRHCQGDWADVRPLIEAEFEALPEVEVRLFEPAGAPDPKTMEVRTKRPRMTSGRAAIVKVLDTYCELNYGLSKIEVHKLALVRPNLRKLHGLKVAEVDAILIDLAQNAIVLTPVDAPPAPDPDEQLLRGILAARADLLLVTGDKLRLWDAGMRARVISPHAFVALP